ncbi:MAG: hypothetical protein ACLGGX_05950 [Bdellovibrionia bacterium]
MKKSFLIIVILVLSACSRTDLALRFADDVLAYEINSQFDFVSSQKVVANKTSEEFVLELKKAMLPYLVQEIQEAKKVLQQK